MNPLAGGPFAQSVIAPPIAQGVPPPVGITQKIG